MLREREPRDVRTSFSARGTRLFIWCELFWRSSPSRVVLSRQSLVCFKNIRTLFIRRKARNLRQRNNCEHPLMFCVQRMALDTTLFCPHNKICLPATSYSYHVQQYSYGSRVYAGVLRVVCLCFEAERQRHQEADHFAFAFARVTCCHLQLTLSASSSDIL